jgi:hypothetical protein
MLVIGAGRRHVARGGTLLPERLVRSPLVVHGTEAVEGTLLRMQTLGADKLYDTREFVAGCRARGITPHVAQNTSGRSSNIDGRTTRHARYALSQRHRKKVEEGFGWGKTVGLLHKLRHRGVRRMDWVFTFTAAAYNLVRLRSLLPGAVCPLRGEPAPRAAMSAAKHPPEGLRPSRSRYLRPAERLHSRRSAAVGSFVSSLLGVADMPCILPGAHGMPADCP